MTWTKEGHEMNSNARSSRVIESAKTKDIKKIAEISGFDKPIGEIQSEVIQIRIRRLLEGGWLEEKKDKYVMTEKARKRVKMLHDAAGKICY